MRTEVVEEADRLADLPWTPPPPLAPPPPPTRRPGLAGRVQPVLRDLSFLLGCIWGGVGVGVLLGGGLLVLVTITVLTGVAAVYVLPILGFLAVGLWLATAAVGLLVPAVRYRVRRRRLRWAAGRSLAAVGRALATIITWWLLGLRARARRARTRVAVHRRVPIPMAYLPLPHGRGATLRVILSDPGTWRDLGYLLVGPALAIAALLATGALFFGGVAGVISELSEGELVRGSLLDISAALTMLVLSPFVVHLLTGVVAAVGLSLLSPGENVRMRAELDEQRLRRQFAVDAAERERRRIERDLHDGAQQRLVALGITLGLARESLPAGSVGADLVEEAHEQAKLALAELRDLARGIHPAILGDRGLDAALSDLLRRSPVPASILVTVPTRPPTAVESAAYFVVSEALTNIARHSGATRCTISIATADGALLVEVADDGVGGADPLLGTGLAGLADRVEALDGHLAVESPLGGPTTVTAVIPCGS